VQSDLDLSYVSYILTCNDDSVLPGPLRDRLRIVRLPRPTLDHLPALARGIVADIAREHGALARHRGKTVGVSGREASKLNVAHHRRARPRGREHAKRELARAHFANLSALANKSDYGNASPNRRAKAPPRW
jgi:hypothetical protein